MKKKFRFFLTMLSFLLKSFVYGMVVKRKSLILMFDWEKIILFFFFLKKSSVFMLNCLMDIFSIELIYRKHTVEVVYVLLSYTYNIRFFLKTAIMGFTFICFSCTSVFPSSNWLEREIYDLFGVKFLLNKDMRRILTDYGFLGFPLRKGFPLAGFTELRYDDRLQVLVWEPVELSQDFRFFHFENPWFETKFSSD